MFPIVGHFRETQSQNTRLNLGKLPGQTGGTCVRAAVGAAMEVGCDLVLSLSRALGLNLSLAPLLPLALPLPCDAAAAWAVSFSDGRRQAIAPWLLVLKRWPILTSWLAAPTCWLVLGAEH